MRRTITNHDRARAVLRALRRAQRLVRITPGQRESIVNNVTIKAEGDPEQIAEKIADELGILRKRYRHYYSTYCIHELHDQCRLSCKHCKLPCLCACHHWQDTAERLAKRVEDLEDALAVLGHDPENVQWCGPTSAGEAGPDPQPAKEVADQ